MVDEFDMRFLVQIVLEVKINLSDAGPSKRVLTRRASRVASRVKPILGFSRADTTPRTSLCQRTPNSLSNKCRSCGALLKTKSCGSTDPLAPETKGEVPFDFIGSSLYFVGGFPY